MTELSYAGGYPNELGVRLDTEGVLGEPCAEHCHVLPFTGGPKGWAAHHLGGELEHGATEELRPVEQRLDDIRRLDTGRP